MLGFLGRIPPGPFYIGFNSFTRRSEDANERDLDSTFRAAEERSETAPPVVCIFNPQHVGELG